jgi:hypothetical protein
MAKKKQPVNADEKLEDQDLNIFDLLTSADKKKYDFFDTLSEEQKKKFAYFMVTQWMSSVSSKTEIQQYYLMSVNECCNKYIFDEKVRNHPKLQWLLLCASSPGIGTQRHQWIPQLSARITSLRDSADKPTVKKYFSAMYQGASTESINEVVDVYVQDHKKKYYLAQNYPNLKLADIETLAQLITDEDIRKNERDKGND